ncbi:MAG: hypothetical protein AAF555_00075 [Verrucomicrobiota bacterium]
MTTLLVLAAGSLGAEERLELPGWVDPIVIELPENYDPAKKWPLLYSWHGPVGGPQNKVVKEASRHRDWILVALAYTKKELLGVHDVSEIQQEIAVWQENRPEIEKRFSVDPGRIFVSGYYTGSWVAAMAMSEVPELAGCLMIGAGFLDRHALPKASLVRGKPIYIGVGSTYENHLPSFRAKERFQAAGAQVIWDPWDFHYKEVPRREEEIAEKPAMRQWMRLVSGEEDPEALREEAANWGRTRLEEISALEDVAERIRRLKRFREQPFARLFGAPLERSIEGRLRALGNSDRGARELRAWDEYERLLQAELRDRSRAASEDYLARYTRLTQEMTGSPVAIFAEAERKRIGATLGR